MPQPILTKYKQGDLGMPYPKKRDKKNMNLSAHGGEADIDVSVKDYPKYTHKPTGQVVKGYGTVKYGYKFILHNNNTVKMKVTGSFYLFDEDDFEIDREEFEGIIDAGDTRIIQGYGSIDYDSDLDRVNHSSVRISATKYN